jgi:7-carboxy-7-deazaguanine synthase
MSQTEPKRIPVVEVFGPTIQGEGALAGLPTYFVRFGGCDYKCVWCDSPYAVLPEYVRQSERLSVDEICVKIGQLPKGPKWVTLSGGNPTLHDLGTLVRKLHTIFYFGVTVETQGTLFKEWLNLVDELTVSPKPPSSGMSQSLGTLRQFLQSVRAPSVNLKVVVFDLKDLDYAKTIHQEFPQYPFYLSCGNYPEEAVGWSQAFDINDRVVSKLHDGSKGTNGPKPDTNQDRARRFRWLAEAVASDPIFSDVRILPQLHVIAWGNERGR